MATVYIIADKADTPFLEHHVLPVLPSNGYNHWLARFHLDQDAGESTISREMNRCQAIITIVSQNLLRSPVFRKEIEMAFTSKSMNIVIQVETLVDKNRLPERLWELPVIDLTLKKQTVVEELLVRLLPTETIDVGTDIPSNARRIWWNERIFNKALALATVRHDHASAQVLVSNLCDYIAHPSYSYPADWAITDMQALRQEREFKLMVSYGDAVFRTGTNRDKVRRLYAQALIETKQYGTAMEVLNSLVESPATSVDEVFEARGLIGRIHKQLYMNDPDAPGSASLLRSAINAYGTAYLDERENFWHGVNTASCMLRLERDGFSDPGFPLSPSQIAKQILGDLDKRSDNGSLPVWDCASKVEALIVLGRYTEARQALEIYIHHQDMTAFEVSSTYRQFKQVLQLDRIPEGAEILARLRYTMERYRAGTVLTSTRPGQGAIDDESNLKALVIRLSDTSWIPGDIPGLTIHSRLGKIVTAEGHNQSVRQLLEDPMIISVEESRPVGLFECARSLPYIKCSDQYTSPAGNFTETGELALIAVIDDSIDVLHKTFLDATGKKSRIVGVWDQTDKNGAGALGFDYGTFHDEDAIAGFLETNLVPPKLGRNGQTHGTHVASIAAGREVGSFVGGVAQDAKLLVIIPNNTGPTGYSKSYIDALFFINKVATARRMPVVVNVSQGMNAGAHDGKSALEAAFDIFSGSGRDPGRVVVKSAGNERDQGGHARITLLTGGIDELSWERHKEAGFTEKIELWWSSANEFRFRLREPVDSLTKEAPVEPHFSDWVGTANQETSGMFPNGGGPYRLKYTKRHIDNGDSLLQIELGQDVDTPVRAGLGQWLLQIEALEIKKGDGEIHCWIERGDGGPPTSFQPPHVSEDMTLSVPGTAETVITVGAIDASKPIKVGKFSSFGPTRGGGEKPQVCAPGVNVFAAEAGTGTGVFCDSGTSMAAPHVAGAIALLLSRAVRTEKVISANQIAQALSQKTQNFNGNWERGQGYGVIDVSALLAAFE